MDNIMGFNVIMEQKGGSDSYYIYDNVDDDDITEEELMTKPVVPCIETTREYILATISNSIYDKLKDMIDDFRNSDIKVKVYQPGEDITFDRELLTTKDYSYPDKTLCCSVLFTDDVISGVDDKTKYYFFGMDMIRCRENVLSEQLIDIML